ncbi:TPA: DUF4416 domain-containing protein [bacterium]|nr:DUF4416 domain-containing protein [bacterium]
MGKIQEPKKAKLVVGMISQDYSLFEKVDTALSEKFGEIDIKSCIFPFDYTSYYNEEMGEGLKRKFVAFKRLIDQDVLPEIKLWTNEFEVFFSLNGKRRVNIDPGYITERKLVLASTKDSYHRIYLGRGIYGEITLYFHNGKFLDFPWTYPDYREDKTKEFLIAARKIYLKERKKDYGGYQGI